MKRPMSIAIATSDVLDADGDKIANFRWRSDCIEMVDAYNAYDNLVNVLKEARAAIIFRMSRCNDDEFPNGNITCTCDWCSDDSQLLTRIDAALKKV